MPIQFTCPHCHESVTVADEYAGQTGPCRSCGNQITIPAGFSPSKPNFSQEAAGPPVKSGGGGLVLILAVLGAIAVVVVLLLVALLVPAVSSARKAAQRASSMNNLKMIGLAMHNYHDVYKTFPTNILNDDDTPRTSWRTAILPFLEQQPLFEMYNFNVDWDSAENMMVRQTPLQVFRSPLSTDPPRDTNYVAVTLQGASIIEDGQFHRMSEITDGTSNTIMVIEMQNTGIEWSEPQDVTLNQLLARLAQGNVSGAGNGFNVLFADGSVQFIANEIDPNQLRALITRNGGDPVNRDF